MSLAPCSHTRSETDICCLDPDPYGYSQLPMETLEYLEHTAPTTMRYRIGPTKTIGY